MRAFLKIVLAIAIALFVITAIRFSTSTSSQNEPSDATAPAQTSFSVTSAGTTYYGSISSDVGVVILQISSSPYLFSFGEPQRADGKFILVRVAIHNGQNTAITMNTSLFEIVDPATNVYSASEKSLELSDDLFLAQINPGVTKIGQVVFDVPADLDAGNLRLRFRGGMTGESAVLPLKVNSVTKPVLASPPATTSAEWAPSGAPAEGPSQASSLDGSSAPAELGGLIRIPTAAPGSPTKAIAVGETEDDVVSALGPPPSITTGRKRIYTYPHLRILFTNGVVSSIQRF